MVHGPNSGATSVATFIASFSDRKRSKPSSIVRQEAFSVELGAAFARERRWKCSWGSGTMWCCRDGRIRRRSACEDATCSQGSATVCRRIRTPIRDSAKGVPARNAEVDALHQRRAPTHARHEGAPRLPGVGIDTCSRKKRVDCNTEAEIGREFAADSNSARPNAAPAACSVTAIENTIY